MATATRPVRVHETTLRQVEGMSRLLGQPPAALLEHAWHHYRESEEFAELLERNRGLVFKVANGYGRDAEDRADLAQEIAAQLFDEVHPWVNAEAMLEPCCVGRLAPPAAAAAPPSRRVPRAQTHRARPRPASARTRQSRHRADPASTNRAALRPGPGPASLRPGAQRPRSRRNRAMPPCP